MFERLRRRPEPGPAAPAPPPGFYGKAPDLGDFVSRRIPSAFVPVWDRWLQVLVTNSQDRLGAGWLDAWLQMPVWHAMLGPGLAGPRAACVVLIPSVDRVGRHFPFTILGCLADAGTALPEWTPRAEALALSALEIGFDPAVLDAALLALGAPAMAPGNPAGLAEAAPAGTWLPPPLPPIAAPRAGDSVWWRRAEAHQPAAILHVRGLPDPSCAADLVTSGGAETPA